MMLPFYAALAGAASPIIAEVKPISPKVGLLMATRSVAEVASDYASAGAPCLSATTGAWHGGTLEMIAQMARTGLPVLRKDFITSRRHLEETALAGAGAVLLTCTLLRRADILRLAHSALEIGLTPFVEAASALELEGLELPHGSILAINNRNIRIKETDSGGVEQSEALFTLARRWQKGLLISASGLDSPDDIRRARLTGYDGVLVGTALLAGPRSILDTTRDFVRAVTLNAEISV